MLLRPLSVGTAPHAERPQLGPQRLRESRRATSSWHSFGGSTVGLLVGLPAAAALRKVRTRGLRAHAKSHPWDNDAWVRGYSNAKQEECYTLHCEELPPDLRGTYFRNGPAKFNIGPDQILHPFDSDGMVSAMTFDGAGGLHFRNRFVRTKGFVEELAANKMLYKGQFSLKPGGWMANAFDMRVKNLANTNVLHWGGRLFALWEADKPTELDSLSLATLGESSLDGALAGDDHFTAHPRFDPRNDRLVGFYYDPKVMDSVTKLTFFEFGAQGFTLENKVEMNVPGFGVFHDFIVTERFYVLSQAPLGISPETGLLMMAGFKSSGEALTFDDSKPSQLLIIPRDGSPMMTVDVDTHFCFHFANGFEADGELVVDMIRIPRLSLGDSSGSQTPVWESTDMSALPMAQLWRYTVTLGTQQWSKRPLVERYIDFPSIALRLSGKPYRYTYCCPGASEKTAAPSQGLLKVDVQEGRTLGTWLPEPHEFLGEPLFCPRPGHEAEDAGYVISSLVNGRDRTSELLVFDAQDVGRGPISRVRLPTFVPYALHGTWVPDLVPEWGDIEAAWRKVPTSVG